MINHDDGSVVDLIGERDKDSVIEWLKEYPNVKLVTRDGSTLYASAINEALPNAIQISDRYHLFDNITKAAIKEIKKIVPKIIKVKKIGETKIKNNSHQMAQSKLDKEKSVNYERRVKIFEEVKRRYEECRNISKVAEEFKMNWVTIKKYIKLDELPPREQIRSSNLDKYANYIIDNVDKSTVYIYNNIKDMGYPGRYSNLKKYVDKLKRGKEFVEKHEIIERKNITKLLFNKGINDLPISKEEKEKLSNYLKENKLLLEIIMIVTNFRIMMFSESKDKLDNWLIETKQKNYEEFNSFVNAVNRDYNAVVNCVLKLDYSNGVVEGNVNKLKNIKKCMYGRCGLDLLKSKVIFSSKSR